MTQVFISWSGDASKPVASAFRELVRRTLHTDRIFWSDRDMAKGRVWFDQLTGALAESTFCVVIATPEALSSKWVIFEIGAVWRAAAESKVSALTIGVDERALEKTPFSHFQNTRCVRDEVLQLMLQLHEFFGPRVGQDIVTEAFDAAWPQFDAVVQSTKFEPLKESAHVTNASTSAVEISERLDALEVFMVTREQRLIQEIRQAIKAGITMSTSAAITGQSFLATADKGSALKHLGIKTGRPGDFLSGLTGGINALDATSGGPLSDDISRFYNGLNVQNVAPAKPPTGPSGKSKK